MEILLECCKKSALHFNTTRLRKGMLADKELNVDPPQKRDRSNPMKEEGRKKLTSEGGGQEEAYELQT